MKKQMGSEIWQREEQKFLQATEEVRIPNAQLDDVAYITPKTSSELDYIPCGGGCYWIWTTEPVLHYLHKNRTPNKFGGGEVIYNGIAKDDVRGRVRHHLFGDINAGWSGISLDIYFDETRSHKKKAMAKHGKVPYIRTTKLVKRSSKSKNLVKGQEMEVLKPIRSKEDLGHINLSESEKTQLTNSNKETLHFRNGIDLNEEKHSEYEFRIYYITGLTSLYLEYIEKKWRLDNGLPRLCSYNQGK